MPTISEVNSLNAPSKVEGSVKGKIKSKEEVRNVNSKSGGALRVCDAILADDSGEIGMSLWQDDVDNVKVDDTVEIIDGYLTEFREQKKLGKGKFGRMLINPTD
jgi:ssDNA-binding replication factor A large subunit|tara:strand:- start:72 stop:383 length:312 start_codon:yes stop_codon:yes gene_type:complete